MLSRNSVGSCEQEFSFSKELLCAKPHSGYFTPGIIICITAGLLDGPSFSLTK